MKKQIFFLSFCFIANISFCQESDRDPGLAGVVTVMDFTDLDGNSLLKKYDPAVTGSPFIINNWVPAKITLTKGKVIDPIYVKLNIESNELYFRDSTGKEMIAKEGLVRKVVCFDFSKDNIQYVFKNGYPAIDKQNENYYYQLYRGGKIELLAKRTKYIRLFKNEISGEITKEFVDGGIVLYVYANNGMQVLHRTKSFVVSLMKDKEDDINKFIDANKINFKKHTDLIKLFGYYNGVNDEIKLFP
jgi:hypothetical protein